MDVQFYGANCLSLNLKNTRLVVDDNLEAVGKKTIVKAGDVVLNTFEAPTPTKEAKIVIDCPGEYEVADISIVGIPAKSHIDPNVDTTMYKVATNDIDILITGHIDSHLTEKQLEAIGMCDVLIVPVGGNGYTLDAKGALNVIKEIEPKLVIPTHYGLDGLNYEVPQASLADCLKEMGMEPKSTTQKLRLKSSELSDVTQLVVVEAV